MVLDTPGMRELQLWEGEDGVQMAFEEIEAPGQPVPLSRLYPSAVSLGAPFAKLWLLELWTKSAFKVTRSSNEK